MLKYLKKSKKTLYSYLFFTPLASLIGFGYLFIIQYVTDMALGGSLSDVKQFGFFALCYIGLDAFVYFMQSMSQKKLIQISMIHLKEDLMRALLKKDITDFFSHNTSYYISLFNNDLKLIEEKMFNNYFYMYKKIFGFTFAIVCSLFISPLMTLIITALGLLSLTIPIFFSNKLTQSQSSYTTHNAHYTSKINDILSGFEVIKSFNIQKQVVSSHDDYNQRLENSKYSYNRLNFIVTWINMNVTQIMYIMAFVLGVYLVIKGQITIGSVVAMSQLIGSLVAPINDVSNALAEIKSVKPLTEKLDGILQSDANEQVESLPLPKDFNVYVKDLSFSYDQEYMALKHINLTFKKHKKYALVGPSGCGKSSLVKLLLHFYCANSGAIMINDTPINDLPARALYQGFAAIHQQVFMFDDTLRNNITLYKDYPEEAIQKVITLTKLDELINRLPQGIDSPLTENGKILSGGEKQRISIARALIQQASFLILDEATANLDAETAYHIESTLLHSSDATCLFITHHLNPNILQEMDCIYVMKDGQIIEQGTFDELYHKKEYFYALYTVNR